MKQMKRTTTGEKKKKTTASRQRKKPDGSRCRGQRSILDYFLPTISYLCYDKFIHAPTYFADWPTTDGEDIWPPQDDVMTLLHVVEYTIPG